MLNSGKKIRALLHKKKNILTHVLSEKKILNETRSEMKRNQRKQNEIDWYEENGRKKIKDKAKLRNEKKR
jgi:hypothetical protein